MPHTNRDNKNSWCFSLVRIYFLFAFQWGRRGRDRMVVGLITTYAISAYHH
jgi:hypothetical protein